MKIKHVNWNAHLDACYRARLVKRWVDIQGRYHEYMIWTHEEAIEYIYGGMK